VGVARSLYGLRLRTDLIWCYKIVFWSGSFKFGWFL